MPKSGTSLKALEIFRSPQLLPIWDVKNRDKLDEYQKEIVRFVHNTVSSAVSFLAHCVRHARSRYRRHPFNEEFHGQHTSRIANSGLCTFVSDFRDFLQHEGMLPTVATMSFRAPAGIPERRIALRVASLRDSSVRWRPSALAYLNQLGDELDLEHVLPAYRQHIVDFRDWYVTRVLEIEAAIVAEAEAIKEEMRPLLPEHDAQAG